MYVGILASDRIPAHTTRWGGSSASILTLFVLNTSLACLTSTWEESGNLETLPIPFCSSQGLVLFKFNHNPEISSCALLILSALLIISFYHGAVSLFWDSDLFQLTVLPMYLLQLNWCLGYQHLAKSCGCFGSVCGNKLRIWHTRRFHQSGSLCINCTAKVLEV